jgi:hypothetical protein
VARRGPARAFAYAFYLLFGVLSAHLIVTVAELSTMQARTNKRTGDS